MKMRSHARQLHSIFPLLTIKDGIIVSKRGDITAGWEVELPHELSMDEKGYEGIVSSIRSAIIQCPDWTMIHRQDIYIREEYVPEAGRSFLDGCFESHFSGRPRLKHRQFIYMTFSDRSAYHRDTSASGIFGITHGVFKDMEDRLWALSSKAVEFESMLQSKAGFVMKRLDTEELTERVWQQFNLNGPGDMFSDIGLSPDECRIGENRLWAFSFCESDQMPGEIPSSRKDRKLNSPTSGLHVSSGAPLGAGLGCEHMVNQYIFKVPEQTIISELSARRRRMQSMSREADNRMHGEVIDEYIEGSTLGENVTVKSHLNILVWGKPERFLEIKSRVSSAVAELGFICVQDTYSAPVLWYSAIPGAACELGQQNMVTMELSGAVCMGINETHETDIPDGTLKLCDRRSHFPIRLDIHKAASEAGFIGNYNAFILGGSGTGKSFFTNLLVRNCYDAGESVFIIDVGDSYEGLCAVIREDSGGKDGFYYTWDEKHPISFDAFIGWESWTDRKGHLRQDCSGVTFIKSLLQTLWSPKGGWTSSSQAVLDRMIEEFTLYMKDKGCKPIFDDFYRFVAETVRKKMRSGSGYSYNMGEVTESNFDISDFVLAMSPYSIKGPYGTLLNDRSPKDILEGRFTVFEVDRLSTMGDKTFYSLCILCILNIFEAMMRTRRGAKTLIIEEAWMAIANDTSAAYLNSLWKTARKFSTSATVVTQQATDIMNSQVIKDTILQNSDVKILLDQSNSLGMLAELSKLLGLDAHQTDLVRSMSKGSQDGYRYKEVFICLGGVRSGVYATEVSRQEAVAYESNKDRKKEFLDLSARVGTREAIRRLTDGGKP